MNRDFFRKKGISALMIMMIYSLIFPYSIFALPQGANVVNGAVDISVPNSATMNINQGTHKAIINWQQFNIANPETVRFLQPGASSVALNRVIGADPSAIYGLLTANGKLFLINPNGILVGPGGRIQANSFMASTMDIRDEDFLSGQYKLFKIPEKSLAGILNQGTISAANGGNVALMAPGVENQGQIVANLGKVFIGAGEQVTLSFEGNELIKFAVDKEVMEMIKGPDGKPMDHAIDNSGRISANGGEVVLSARVAYEAIKSVVNNSGIIEAESVGQRAGSIKLDGEGKGDVVNSGTLNVAGTQPGETGGSVEVTGERVKLVHYSKIKASGFYGAGKVSIGGGFQGKNKKIRNAKQTYIGKNATIEADALSEGDGGDVVVWSDDTTRFYGKIDARGGAKGGDGGSVEVSGKKQLDFKGYVDLSAANGNAGTLLLDPEDLTVEGSENTEEAAGSDGAEEIAGGESGEDETEITENPPEPEAPSTGSQDESEGEVGEEVAGVPESTENPGTPETVNPEEITLAELKSTLEESGDFELLELILLGETELGETELLAMLAENGLELSAALDADALSQLIG